MKANLAVCGRFHYHNYVRYLDQAGVLGRFYYSHRISTGARQLGVSSVRAHNLWLKEHLTALHGRLTRGRLITQCLPFYSDLWQGAVLRRWQPCDVLHFLIHGACQQLIARSKSEGAAIVGEAVNQHPEALNALLAEECNRLDVPFSSGLYEIHRRQLSEVHSADYLLCPSGAVRASFVARGFAPDRAVVIPYGVDLGRFPNNHCGPAPADAEPFRVICVAQITPRKGHVYLLEAWKRLRLPNSELLLIGFVSAEMAPVLRRYRGIFKHIPAVPNDQLYTYYLSSSAFVLPSIEDGFGLVCSEAMACGLPVIATENAGAAEIISHRSDGFVVPIRSPEAIARCLEELYRNRGLRRFMSHNARAKAERDLSWETYALKLMNFHQSAFERKTQGPRSARELRPDQRQPAVPQSIE